MNLNRFQLPSVENPPRHSGNHRHDDDCDEINEARQTAAREREELIAREKALMEKRTKSKPS